MLNQSSFFRWKNGIIFGALFGAIEKFDGMEKIQGAKILQDIAQHYVKYVKYRYYGHHAPEKYRFPVLLSERLLVRTQPGVLYLCCKPLFMAHFI